MEKMALALALIPLGLIASVGMLVLGLIIVIGSRGSPLSYWPAEIFLLFLIWRSIFLRLQPRRTEASAAGSGWSVLDVARGAAAVAFLVLWRLAVAASGGRASLPFIGACATSSVVLLVLISIPDGMTGMRTQIERLSGIAGVFVAVGVGFLYLGGGI